ncbi:MAG: flagellar hook protein FlgE [Proteobacteria bacterium]|nr:flagellar hook protein FlgE [Pseudomonadota bacterium]
MSINTAASGLTAAQAGLNTVSNDLANASTTGFKDQTALFSAIYAANEPQSPGIGVQSAGLETNFTQGNQTTTGNGLNAAIQGNGFFIINNGGSQQYTRDGAFQLNSSGSLVTASGASVLGFATNKSGAATGGLASITVNTGALAANPTTKLGLTVGLNTTDSVFATATTPVPGNTTTYNEATSVVAYDSLGNANTVNLYLQQEAPAAAGGTPTWNVYAQPVTSSGTVVSAPAMLTKLSFNTDGTLAGSSAAAAGQGANSAPLTVGWGNGAASSNVAFDFTGTTLGAQSFAISGTTNNGYAPGSYTGASINSTGQVQATYSNGQTLTAGTLGLSNFINDQGLQALSGNLYAQTTTSGQPVVNVPGAGQAGTLLSGKLEQSNVATSSALVNLIQYQQAYEANATAIQTEQTDFTRLSQI